jgi:xanthine dehydrogenase accessory factor
MRELLPDLEEWWLRSRPFALATLVEAVGSAPLPVGTAMAADERGAVLGAISGGCVDADVAATAEHVLREGRPELRRYGPADTADDVSGDVSGIGLTCGGTLSVWVEPVVPHRGHWLPAVAVAVRRGRPVTLATRLDPARPGHLVLLPDGSRTGSIGGDQQDGRARAAARLLLPEGGSVLLPAGSYAPPGDANEDPDARFGVFVTTHAPPPLLLLVSWTPVADHLARMGAQLGYRVVVLEHRPAFGAQAEAAGAEVVPGLPQTTLGSLRREALLDVRSAVVVLTHDARVDVPALLEATSAGVGYVGAMGSAATHRDRHKRLRAAGMDAADLARINSPIGLPLGGRAPAEIATAIAAQLVLARNGLAAPVRDVSSTP